MKFRPNIKINSGALGKRKGATWLWGIPPRIIDGQCLNVEDIKFFSTWKTTRENRHPEAASEILEITARLSRENNSVRILEAGASTGQLFVPILKDLLTERDVSYSLTDASIYACCIQAKGFTALLDIKSGRMFMAWSRWFIFYNDNKSRLLPLTWISRSIFRVIDQRRDKTEMLIPLVDGRVRRILEASQHQIRNYNIIDIWDGPKQSLALYFNVLNPDYFSGEELREIVRNIFELLDDGGYVVFGEEIYGVEQFAILRKQDNAFHLVKKTSLSPRAFEYFFGLVT